MSIKDLLQLQHHALHIFASTLHLLAMSLGGIRLQGRNPSNRTPHDAESEEMQAAACCSMQLWSRLALPAPDATLTAAFLVNSSSRRNSRDACSYSVSTLLRSSSAACSFTNPLP